MSMSPKWLVLTAVACGTFMATLDASIVNIALPTLTKALGADLHQIKWIVIVYLLVITCLLLPFGRLADLYGRKRVFQVGFLIFTLGSALCAVSGTLALLMLSRAVQGVGAAMLMANSPALITAVFPAGERGKALGTLAMVVSAGLISGPSLGGVLITKLGWASIFLVNLPIGFGGALLVQHYVRPDPPPTKTPTFDWAGAILQLLLLLSFMVMMEPPTITFESIALNQTSTVLPVSRFGMGLLVIILGVLFVKVESQVEAPLFDLSLLKIRTFWIANLAAFLTFVAYSSMTVLMPFFLEEVLKFTPDKAGLFMTAVPLTIFVVAPVSGRLSDRLGSRGLSLVGALIGAIGLFLMGGAVGRGITEQVSHPSIVVGLCSIGLATGLFQSPNNNRIMSSVPVEKLGVASALLATIRNLGLVTGTSLATGLFAWRRYVTGDFVSALHFTFFVGGVIALGAMLASGSARGKEAGGTN